MAKRALLCGCNYPGSNAALNGCINDVFSMKNLLEEVYGFQSGDIVILIDTDDEYESPTGGNIKRNLKELVNKSDDGDVLVFHFSGHGTQVPDDGGDEADGKDEAIVPTDMNVIADEDMRSLLKGLKDGVMFTMVSDCCHSGGMLDHQEVQISGRKDGGPEAGGLPLDALMGMFGLKGLPDSLDPSANDENLRNRSMSPNLFLQMLGGLMGGKDVHKGNIRASMADFFGNDASSGSINYMAIAQQLMAQVQGGGAGASSQPKNPLMGMLMSCFSGLGGAGGGNTASSAAPGEPNLNLVMPTAGQKPPSNQQLGEDKGVLITGCQAHETSADACPSGDKSKAYGALSNALNTVIREHHKSNPGKPITYRQLVTQIRALLGKTGFAQNPCLECSNKNADSPFICKPVA